MKVYLDTNILYAYLKKRLEEKIKGNYSNGKPPFLQEITPLTSFLTLGEIVEVIRGEMKINKNVIEEFVKKEIEKLQLEIVRDVSIDKEFLDWCLSGLELKDALHLKIVKQYQLPILTNDIKLLEFSKSLGIRAFRFADFKNLSFKK